MKKYVILKEKNTYSLQQSINGYAESGWNCKQISNDIHVVGNCDF